MRRVFALLAILLIAGSPMRAALAFRLSSPSIRPGSTLPDTHVFNAGGCTGANTSPALTWTDAPAGTKSFAVTAYDPDAPTGSGWWHWVIYNIPASVTSLPEGAGAPGKESAGAVQAVNDYGTPGFGGACPPKGDKPHRYIFTVYALKTDKLPIPANASPAAVGFNIHAETLAKASFTAHYGR